MQGNVEAQFNLSGMYYQGKGTQQNKAEALRWLDRSCKNGYKDACRAYQALK